MRHFSKHITVRVDEELMGLLEREHKRRTPKGSDQSLSDIVRVLLHEAIAKGAKS